jgi:hypothetical protein
MAQRCDALDTRVTETLVVGSSSRALATIVRNVQDALLWCRGETNVSAMLGGVVVHYVEIRFAT